MSKPSDEAVRLMEVLHDLYGHTFDILGEEAIKHALQASRSAAIQECAELTENHTCRSMAAKELLRDRVLALKER